MGSLTDAKVAAIKPPAQGQEEHRDSKVTGLRLRVGTTGKKTWIVRARAGARVVNKKLGTYPAMRLGAARTAAERILEAIAKDGSAYALDRTFGDLADAWIAKGRMDGKRSIEHQRRQLERHVLPHWRDRKLVDIRRSDVRDLIEGIEGGILPNRVLAAVRAALGYAVEREWIEASPAHGVRKPKEESPRDRFLDMVDVKRIWEASGLLGYPYGPFVRLLLLTGQRRTEVASMRWKDVDLDTGRWILAAADTKADRRHLVPLSPIAVEQLKPLPRFGAFVFSTDGETHIKGYAKGKGRLDAFLAAAGDPLAPWTLHDLRRTVATHLVRLGVSIEDVAYVLNHARAGVTAKTYALHDKESQKRSALDRWAAELMRAVEGKSADKVVPLRRGK